MVLASPKKPAVLRILNQQSKVSSTDRYNALMDLVNSNAEEAVIGAVLLDPAQYYSLAEIIQPEDFGILSNGFYWKAFAELVNANQPIDLVTVWEELRKPMYDALAKYRTPDAEAVYHQDTARYHNAAASTENAEHYARIVLESAIRIRHIQAMHEVEKAAFDKSLPIETVIAQSGAAVFEAGRRSSASPTDIASLVSAYHDDMLSGTRPHLIPLGLPNHDDETGGISCGEVSIVAGAPGMGKTTLALSLILEMAKTRRVVLFSLEMSRDEILNKLVSMMTGLPLRVMQNRNFSEAQRAMWFDALSVMTNLKLNIIDDAPSLTPAMFRTRMLRLMHQVGTPDVAVIDGLWLMSGDSQYKERFNEVNEITRQLAEFARQYQIALLLMHQYKDDIRKRTDHTPTLGDLAEATAVQRNIQYALGLHNPNYYDHDQEAEHSLHVLKARNKDIAHGASFGIHWNTEYRRYEGMKRASFDD